MSKKRIVRKYLDGEEIPKGAKFLGIKNHIEKTITDYGYMKHIVIQIVPHTYYEVYD
jgi:hypothetical protein